MDQQGHMGRQGMEDQVLTCVDCGVQFDFSARDQAFYQERGYQAPRRCKTCRDKRKPASPAGAQGPRGHDAGHGPHARHGGGHSGYGQPRSGGQHAGYGRHSGGPSSAQGQSHSGYSPRHAPAPDASGSANQFKVTCSGCGAATTVPFKPSTNRPVYCRTCYLSKRKPQ
jgi:CxxC-x17-CxxC domain-containing protein